MAVLVYRDNLTLWLKGGTIIYNDGSAVTEWGDSLNGAPGLFVQGTGANQPIFKGNQVNGRPCARFDGTDDYLQGPVAISNYMSSTIGTVFVVFKAISIGGNNAAVADNDSLFSTDNGTFIGAVLKSTPPEAHAYVSDGAVQDSGGTPIVVGQTHILTWRHSGGNVSVDIDGNGAVSAAAGAVSNMTGALRIGSQNVGATRSANVDIFEVLVYSVNVTGRFFDQVQHYLKEQYQTYGDPVEQQRDTASRRLVYMRRPRLVADFEAPIWLADADLLDDVAVTHPEGVHPTGAGWGHRTYERRPMRLLESAVDFDNFKVLAKLGDQRYTAYTYVETGETIRSNDLVRDGDGASGVGTVRFCSRNTKAWVENPGGRQIVEVLHDQEKIAYGGLLVENFENNEYPRSAFVAGTGGLTLTGTGVNGSAIATDSGSPMLFDTAVTTNSIKLTAGNPHTTDLYFRRATASLTANTKVRVVIDHRDASGTALAWRLSRGIDGFFWNDGTQAWGAGSVWNNLTITSGTSVIEQHASTGNFSVGTGATTLTLDVGQPSGGTASRINYVYYCGIQSAANSAVITSRIVTQTGTVFRGTERLFVGNHLGQRTFNAAHGTARVRFKPLWSAAEMGTNVPYIFHVAYNDDPTHAHTFWLRWNGATGNLEFTSKVAGTSYTATKAWTPVNGTEYALTSRWTGSDGELGLTPFTNSVFVDGVKGTDAVAPSAPTETDVSHLFLGCSMTLTNFAANGSLRNLEFMPVCLTDEEIATW